MTAKWDGIGPNKAPWSLDERAMDHVTTVGSLDGPPVDQAVFLAVGAIYSKAFVEALAKRHADGLADLVRTRIHRRGKSRGREVEIGVDSDAAAKVMVTEDLPDEARLALLDLDVTADELRGKLLRWDSSASAWRPDPDD
jgi:hypothetical protein